MKEFNNNNLQEFPVYADEFTTSVSNLQPNELEISKGNQTFDSEKNLGEKDLFVKKSKRKKADLNSLMKLLSVCMLTITVGVGVIVGTDSTKVVSAVFESQLNAIEYLVEIESDKEVILRLENDFTNREVQLANGVNQGVISGLKQNMKYTVSLLTGEGIMQTSIKKYTVKTLTPEQAIPPTSEFFGVDFIPAENLSGSAKIKVDFDNRANEWSSLSLNVCDQTGINVTIENVICNEEYSLNLLDNGFLSSRATLSVSVLNAKTSQTQIIYQTQLSLSALETYYEVNLTKADSYGYAIYSFEIIDENGLWHNDTKFNVSLVSEESDFEYLTENYIANTVLTRFISKNEFASGKGILKLQAIKNGETFDLLTENQTLVTDEWFTRESKTGFLSIETISAENLNGIFNFTVYYANEEELLTRVYVEISDKGGFDYCVVDQVENGKTYTVDLSEFGFLTSSGVIQVYTVTQEYEPSSGIMIDVPMLEYQENVVLSQVKTDYQVEIVQPAGVDNICTYKVDFVDENGVWGENFVFKVKFSSETDYTECILGEMIQFTVFNTDYPEGIAYLEIVININGEDQLFEYLELNLVGDGWLG